MTNTPLINVLAGAILAKQDSLWSLTNTLEGLVIKEARVVDGKLKLYLAKLTEEKVQTCEDCPECDCSVEAYAETKVVGEAVQLILTVSLDAYEYLR
jgi:hypothetical protein